MSLVEPVFGATGLDAGYHGVPVVHDVRINVAPGEVVVLLGANGAGKTTTLRALTGALPAMAGDVLWRGASTRAPLSRRVRDGLAVIPERRLVFRSLSTEDNLRLGRGSVDAAVALMPELGPLLGRRAGLLSGGEQQMLALGRALASGSAALVADELSLGLAPMIVTRLLDSVRAAADRGLAVLLVEQHVRQAIAMADRGYVLSRGRIVLEGTCNELSRQITEIESTYLSGVSTRQRPNHTKHGGTT
jgi:branched-chain amino acid transport system ATP-binding protein